MRVLWRLTNRSFIDGRPETTPGNVKLLLPPRQSRGNSHGNSIGALHIGRGIVREVAVRIPIATRTRNPELIAPPIATPPADRRHARASAITLDLGSASGVRRLEEQFKPWTASMCGRDLRQSPLTTLHEYNILTRSLQSGRPRSSSSQCDRLASGDEAEGRGAVSLKSHT